MKLCIRLPLAVAFSGAGMIEDPNYEADRPLRRRRGPPPRLYVIARQSPAPWVQVRRLGQADRDALANHLVRLNPSEPRATLLATQFCAALDFDRIVGVGAFARNAIVVAALGIDTVPGGVGIGVAVQMGWRGRGLQRLLVGQVGDAPGPDFPLAAPLCRAMAGVWTQLGGRMVAVDKIGANWVGCKTGLGATG